MNTQEPHPAKGSIEPRLIKCVVWDLDNTIWDGILLEDQSVHIKHNVVNIIKVLDNRGILQSIASRNSQEKALAQLREFGIVEYFLYPQIRWDAKSESIRTIAQEINIGFESIALIDDEEFEREEVLFALPNTLCIDAAKLDSLLEMPELNPRFITEDSKKRRQMYISDMSRKIEEESYSGPKEEFLASLNMRFSVFPANEEDLKRAEELTVRTHQLNTTGYTYSYGELSSFRKSSQHQLLMARLEDRFGTYGHIGLALVECQQAVWKIKLLLMSCRIISRGIGTIMLSHIMKMAKKSNARLLADFVPNDRNRMMDITYRLSGFDEIDRCGDLITLEHNLQNIQPFPDYVEVKIHD
jgi:FkbH-like protein